MKIVETKNFHWKSIKFVNILKINILMYYFYQTKLQYNVKSHFSHFIYCCLIYHISYLIMTKCKEKNVL